MDEKREDAFVLFSVMREGMNQFHNLKTRAQPRQIVSGTRKKLQMRGLAERLEVASRSYVHHRLDVGKGL